MKHKYLLLWSIVFFCLGASAATVFADSSIQVFAAASMTGPLKEIAQAYEQVQGVSVKLNFASSGTLAHQIEQGARANVYISASKKWMDYLEEKEAIRKETRINPVRNSIVLIAPRSSKEWDIRFTKDYSFADAFNGKFAVGNPKHVPAGKYAQKAMQSLGWWESLDERLILTKDVRHALMIVEAQEVEFGTVYASDAKQSSKVKVVGQFPLRLHPPIVYSAALSHHLTEEEKGQKFLSFLMQETAQNIFRKYGFTKASSESLGK